MSIRAMPRSRVLARESSGAEHIMASAVLDPHTVLTRNGDLVQVIAVDGFPFETAEESRINAAHEGLNLLWRNLASTDLTLYSHLIRRRTAVRGGGHYTGFAHALHERYGESLGRLQLYRNELRLSLVHRPPFTRLNRMLGLLSRGGRDRQAYAADIAEALAHLDETAGKALAFLERHGARRLGTYECRGQLFSEVAEFLAFLLNGYRQPVPVGRTDLARVLLTARPLFGHETIELRGPERSRFAAVLAIKEYPPRTLPVALQALLTRDYEFNLTQSFSFASRQGAAARMATQQRRLVAAGDFAQSQVAEIGQGLDDLVSGHLVMGEHHFSMVVLGDSLPALAESTLDARTCLADAGCVVAREDLACEAAIWAQLPGNMSYRPRLSLISNRNFSGFSPFHNFPGGRREGNHWGEAVSLLTTAAGSPYWFNFHSSDVGHTLLLGPTGSGKTALQGFLLTQLTKFDPSIVFFDKDRGAELMVRATGGAYAELKLGRPSGLNPFRALPPTPAHQDHLVRLIELLVTGGGSLTALEEKEVVAAVRAVFELPEAQRRLARVRDFLDRTAPDGVFARLERWTEDGRQAWLFDNPEDRLDFSARGLQGFDITGFLDAADVRAPCLFHLFYRIEQLLTGQPFVLFIDEFWKALRDPVFERYIEDRLNTLRKKNGFLVAATQSPSHVFKSPISHTITGMCATKLFLPDPAAEWAAYGPDGFGLSRREFEIIRTLPKRHFLLRQGHDSVVLRLELGALEDELAILSGTTHTVALAEQIRARAGDDPDRWLPAFHQARRHLAKDQTHATAA